MPQQPALCVPQQQFEADGSSAVGRGVAAITEAAIDGSIAPTLVLRASATVNSHRHGEALRNIVLIIHVGSNRGPNRGEFFRFFAVSPNDARPRELPEELIRAVPRDESGFIASRAASRAAPHPQSHRIAFRRTPRVDVARLAGPTGSLLAFYQERDAALNPGLTRVEVPSPDAAFHFSAKHATNPKRRRDPGRVWNVESPDSPLQTSSPVVAKVAKSFGIAFVRTQPFQNSRRVSLRPLDHTVYGGNQKQRQQGGNQHAADHRPGQRNHRFSPGSQFDGEGQH